MIFYAASIIRHYQGYSLSVLVVVALQALTVLVTGQSSQAEDSIPPKYLVFPPNQLKAIFLATVHLESI